MPDAPTNYAALSKRIDTLERITTELAAKQESCFDELRSWQMEHERKSDKIIQHQEDILALVEAMKWAATTRYVILWAAGATVSLAYAWTWIHDTLAGIIHHKGP